MKEFKIKFSETVYGSGPDASIPFVEKGATLTIDQNTFNKLKSGETISVHRVVGHGVTGYYEYSKKDLENEVVETEVIINTTVRKLGNRKK